MEKFLIIFLISIFSLLINNVVSNETLKLVQILFKHGDKTGDSLSIFPNDPYKYEDFYPNGIGQLTNIGKKRLLTLGHILRHRYGSFLGNIYYPPIVDAISANTDVTKTSLLLVLASLFPPNNSDQIIQTDLNWQPIPYNFLPIKDDKIFFGPQCKNYQRLYNIYINTPTIREKLRKNRKFFQLLSNYTGLNVTDYFQVFLIYSRLKIEKELQLELPQWAQPILPKLEFLTEEFYRICTGTRNLKRLSTGYLLEKLLDNAHLKATDKLDKRKIILFSGYEFNLAFLINTLDIFHSSFSNIVPYGAHIIFELHQINGTYGMKILYEDQTFNGPYTLKLPECQTICPLNNFTYLITKYLPNNINCSLN